MDDQNKAVLLLQLMEIAFKNSENDDDECLNVIHSSSSNDEEDEEETTLHTILILNKKRRKLNRRPRIEGFVERVIPRYTGQEFKTHFRYVIFIWIDIILVTIKIFTL